MNQPIPMLKNCPIGCHQAIADTKIVLPEGCLKRCERCFHLFSQCDEQKFISSMEAEFDTAEGTWPPPKNMARLERRTRKTLNRVSTESAGQNER